MSIAQKLLKGSIYRNIELVVLLAVTFVMTPLIVHTLGDRLYGFWSLIGVFLGYYGLLDFGLSSATSRYISRCAGQNATEDMNEVANTAFYLFSIIALIALAVTGIAVAVCPLFLHNPDEIVLFRKIIALLGVLTAVSFPMRVYSGILTSYLRYDQLTTISLIRTVLANISIYYCMTNGYGIMALAVINFAASMAQNAALFLLCKKQYPHIRIVAGQYKRQDIGKMFDYSWKTFLCQLGDVFRFKIDSFLLAGFLNVALVTPYSIGVKLLEGVSQVVSASLGIMTPVFSRYEGRNDMEGVRRALLRVTVLGTVFSHYLCLSTLFYGKAFIARWMGPGFETSYYIMAILCVSSMAALPQATGISLLYGVSKHGYYVVINLCEAAANVILSIIFIKYFGVYGVVLGTCVEMLFFKILVQPIYICRAAQLSVRRYLIDTILVTAVKTAIPLTVLFSLLYGFVTPDYLRIVACFTLQTLCFAPLAYFYIISEADRAAIKKFLTIRFRSAAA